MSEVPTPGEDWTETPIVRGDDLPSAEELRDRASISSDLSLVLGCVSQLLTDQGVGGDEGRVKDAVKDGPTAEALWTTALIAYARCFGPGVRIRLTPQDILGLGLDGEPLQFHQQLMDMRNKHVAHSVNAFEQLAVGIVLSADGRGRVEGTSLLAMRHVGYPPESLNNFGYLVTRLLADTQQKCRDLEGAILEEAKGLSGDDLLSRPRVKLVAPGPEEAARRRN